MTEQRDFPAGFFDRQDESDDATHCRLSNFGHSFDLHLTVPKLGKIGMRRIGVSPGSRKCLLDSSPQA